MSPDRCPVHGLPWKWVPPGTSKTTGKAYAGFHTCPERGCKERPKADAQAAPHSPPAGIPERSGAGTGSRGTLMVVAMQFASRVHQGSGDSLAAMETARMAFKALMAGLPPTVPLKDGDWEPVNDDLGF